MHQIVSFLFDQITTIHFPRRLQCMQRKFRQADEDDSYFNEDDDAIEGMNVAAPSVNGGC